MAEGMGFEPTVRVYPLHQFSKLAPSATRPPLRNMCLFGLSLRVLYGQLQMLRNYTLHLVELAYTLP